MPHNFQNPVGLHSLDENWRLTKNQSLEGYELSLLEDCENAYRLTAVASADKIGQLVCEFSRRLNDNAFFILEYYPESFPRRHTEENQPEPAVFYSPYLPTRELMGMLKPYMERLIHDGFVGFGLANNQQGLEMFYSEEKVLTFFTDNHLRLCDFLQKFNLSYCSELVIPADFLHDHIALNALPAEKLPESLAKLPKDDLDSANFCAQLIDLLDMYQVEEGLSFFLTRKEQQQVAEILGNHARFEPETEFGNLLLGWSDFVTECSEGFSGDLEEYLLGLQLRDLIQYIIDTADAELAEKILSIVRSPDSEFRRQLIDRRRQIPALEHEIAPHCAFWYQGVVRNQNVNLRRDLIRKGWFGR